MSSLMGLKRLHVHPTSRTLNHCPSLITRHSMLPRSSSNSSGRKLHLQANSYQRQQHPQTRLLPIHLATSSELTTADSTRMRLRRKGVASPLLATSLTRIRSMGLRRVVTVLARLIDRKPEPATSDIEIPSVCNSPLTLSAAQPTIGTTPHIQAGRPRA